jgi:deoxycytidylate deaminase
MTNKIKYFNIAREVSRLSDFSRVHIGCVVVYKKQILSVGYNQSKTHTLQAIYNKYRDMKSDKPINHLAHAEIIALSHIKYRNIDWGKVKIYTYRDHKTTGELMIAKPCLACMEYIKRLGIRHIYYTDKNAYSYSHLIS